MTLRVHLDTDLALQPRKAAPGEDPELARLDVPNAHPADPDDIAALALLLARPDVELVAVTTVTDPDGSRADDVRRCLAIGGRSAVPVVAQRDAPDRLARSLMEGATVVAIGPLTNLADLERRVPGALGSARVVAMGGWLQDLGPDLPDWGPTRDYNVAADPDAARLVLQSVGDLTLVTLAATVRTWLRGSDLERLRAGGPLVRLLAEQAVEYAARRGHAALAAAHGGLPSDLLLFLHDPLTCAIALGWDRCSAMHGSFRPKPVDGGLRLVADRGGRPMRVVCDVDGAAFHDWWLSSVCPADGAHG